MFHLFSKCIFCNKDLPNKNTGVGEHVIPLSIYGFWRLYDICKECIKYFGDKVDIFATQNHHILESMSILGIPKVEKFYEQLPFLGEDASTKDKVKMIRRKRGYKSKVVKKSDDFLECSEQDFEKVGIKFLIDKFKNRIEHQILEKELNSLRDRYKLAEPGEIIHSKLLGYSIHKKQLQYVQYDTQEMKPITPLIAKIVFSAIHYFLPLDVTGSFINYWDLRDHARYNKELRDYTINWCMFKNNEYRHHWHRIRFFGGSHTLIVDTTFFGYANWRTLLHSEKEIRIVDIHNNPVEALNFYMDFQDLKNRRKFLSFKYSDGTYREIEFEN